MWKVPLFNTSFDKSDLSAVEDVLKSGWTTMGSITEEFESCFADYIGVKHAVAVANCSSALHLANLAVGSKSNDEIICPSLTFVAGANSILYTGARPVFADIESMVNFTISPDDIKRKITNNTKAIQVMHYAGYPCEMDQILDIAKKYSLVVIEDCAHAHGSTYKGKKCGSIGDIGCFSFFSNKNMTTAEGGMITTNRDDLAEKIRLMRAHGMTATTLDRHKGHAFSYDVVEMGYNYRIDEIRSALGLSQFKKLSNYNKKRKELTYAYREYIANCDHFSIPFDGQIDDSACHIFPILLAEDVNRYALMAYLKSKGIQTSIHYPPAHCFQYYIAIQSEDALSLKMTQLVAEREVTLPLYPSMKHEDVQYVCEYLKKFFSNGFHE